MDIASLSLDSLLIIFDHVFCSTLLSSVPPVCAQWNQLQPVARAKRRRLGLFLSQLVSPSRKKGNFQPNLSPYPYILLPRTFDMAYARALVDSFPAITHLSIFHFFNRIEVIEELYLFEKWGPKLVYILINFDDEGGDVPQGSFERLMPALNSMPRLQKLHLYVPNLPKIDMPVLGRLVEIKLCFRSFDDGIVSQILKHCSTDRARYFDIERVNDFASFAPLLLNEQISSQIRDLKMLQIDNTQLAAIFERCHSIRAFEMVLSLEHFLERLCALANHSSLQKLTLWIAESNPPIPIASINLPVLGIVELWLGVWLTLHDNFVQLLTQLDRVFPQLRIVYFIRCDPHFRCRQCEERDVSSERCTEILRQPLARIAGLEAVNVGNNCHRYLYDTVNWLPRLRQASADTESAKEFLKETD